MARQRIPRRIVGCLPQTSQILSLRIRFVILLFHKRGRVFDANKQVMDVRTPGTYDETPERHTPLVDASPGPAPVHANEAMNSSKREPLVYRSAAPSAHRKCRGSMT